jgi:prevent-host-death family protein
MLKIKSNEDVVIAGTSEFRNSINEFISILKESRVIITKRNKPQAVLISFEEYERYNDIIEQLEDRYFGNIALGRLKDIEDGKSKIIDNNEVIKDYI